MSLPPSEFLRRANVNVVFENTPPSTPTRRPRPPALTTPSRSAIPSPVLTPRLRKTLNLNLREPSRPNRPMSNENKLTRFATSPTEYRLFNCMVDYIDRPVNVLELVNKPIRAKKEIKPNTFVDVRKIQGLAKQFKPTVEHTREYGVKVDRRYKKRPLIAAQYSVVVKRGDDAIKMNIRVYAKNGRVQVQGGFLGGKRDPTTVLDVLRYVGATYMGVNFENPRVEYSTITAAFYVNGIIPDMARTAASIVGLGMSEEAQFEPEIDPGVQIKKVMYDGVSLNIGKNGTFEILNSKTFTQMDEAVVKAKKLATIIYSQGNIKLTGQFQTRTANNLKTPNTRRVPPTPSVRANLKTINNKPCDQFTLTQLKMIAKKMGIVDVKKDVSKKQLCNLIMEYSVLKTPKSPSPTRKRKANNSVEENKVRNMMRKQGVSNIRANDVKEVLRTVKRSKEGVPFKGNLQQLVKAVGKRAAVNKITDGNIRNKLRQAYGKKLTAKSEDFINFDLNRVRRNLNDPAKVAPLTKQVAQRRKLMIAINNTIPKNIVGVRRRDIRRAAMNYINDNPNANANRVENYIKRRAARSP